MSIRSLTISSCAIIAALFATPVQAEDYEVREFSSGAAWLIFDGPLKTALRVAKAEPNQITDLGEFIVLIEESSQLRDAAAIQNSVASAMESTLLNICPRLDGGCGYFNNRSVVGYMEAIGKPDSDGHVSQDKRLFSGSIKRNESTSLIGQMSEDAENPKVTYTMTVDDPQMAQALRDLTLADGREQMTGMLGKFEEEREQAAAKRQDEKTAMVDQVKATFEPILQEQMAATEPESVGLIAKVIGADPETTMVGAWSSSQADCGRDRLLFFQDDQSAPTVAWWQQSPKLKDAGLVPAIQGGWEVRDDIVTLSIKESSTVSAKRGVRTRKENVDVQLQLISSTEEELRLGVPGGAGAPQAAMLLGGANEKLFVRCDGGAG